MCRKQRKNLIKKYFKFWHKALSISSIKKKYKKLNPILERSSIKINIKKKKFQKLNFFMQLSSITSRNFKKDRVKSTIASASSSSVICSMSSKEPGKKKSQSTYKMDNFVINSILLKKNHLISLSSMNCIKQGESIRSTLEIVDFKILIWEEFPSTRSREEVRLHWDQHLH